VTLAFGGDVHFEGQEAARLAADPSNALKPLAALFAGSDLAMVNVESAITTGSSCPQPQSKQYVFHAPPTAYTALRGAGVTVATQANNHGEDCGPTGLAETLQAAHTAGFPVIGIGQDADDAFTPYRATIRGQRIAMIAATDVLDTNLATAWTATDSQRGLASAVDPSRLVAAVRSARASADTVVVYLHWGTENQACPNTSQPPLAAMLIDAGADIVVGTHAHVQLGAGYKGGAFVDYGLGNLAFYDNSPPQSYSGVLDVTVTGHHIDGYAWKPASISGGLPVRLSGTAAKAAVQRWSGLRSCTDLAASQT
jgi:poly-gamma-glutamate synthesis protein (capsule biosynthesis protein)